MRFEKKATPPSLLIPLLQNRGLIIESSSDATETLTKIGYYRFSGYAYPFLADKKAHRFLTGTSFNQIINHYNFDRELRFLLGEALHHIEVTVRTLISDTMSVSVSPHWFLDKSVFQSAYLKKKQPNPNKPPKSGYDDLLDIFSKRSGKWARNDSEKKKRDEFIRHYYDTYTDPQYPPSWMIAEVLTFGDWSVIYSNLASQYRQDIAANLGCISAIYIHG